LYLAYKSVMVATDQKLGSKTCVGAVKELLLLVTVAVTGLKGVGFGFGWVVGNKQS
jgi:hypothetical protein